MQKIYPACKELNQLKGENDHRNEFMISLHEFKLEFKLGTLDLQSDMPPTGAWLHKQSPRFKYVLSSVIQSINP